MFFFILLFLTFPNESLKILDFIFDYTTSNYLVSDKRDHDHDGDIIRGRDKHSKERSNTEKDMNAHIFCQLCSDLLVETTKERPKRLC